MRETNANPALTPGTRYQTHNSCPASERAPLRYCGTLCGGSCNLIPGEESDRHLRLLGTDLSRLFGVRAQYSNSLPEALQADPRHFWVLRMSLSQSNRST